MHVKRTVLAAADESNKPNSSTAMAVAAYGLSDPNLAVNPNAVIEVTPLIRTESDLQRVGEARDESILERKQMGQVKSSESTLIALMVKWSHNIIFRSAICNERKIPFWYKMFGSAWFGWE